MAFCHLTISTVEPRYNELHSATNGIVVEKLELKIEVLTRIRYIVVRYYSTYRVLIIQCTFCQLNRDHPSHQRRCVSETHGTGTQNLARIQIWYGKVYSKQICSFDYHTQRSTTNLWHWLSPSLICLINWILFLNMRKISQNLSDHRSTKHNKPQICRIRISDFKWTHSFVQMIKFPWSIVTCIGFRICRMSVSVPIDPIYNKPRISDCSKHS